jgi:uncharacterized membrane protein
MSEPSHTPNTSQRQAHWAHIGTRAGEIFNVRAEIAKQRTQMPAFIDGLGNLLTHPAFFLGFLAVHLLWIALNLPLYRWWTPWDPYPFVFLATVTSAEAPFMGLLVLMYQQRNQRIAELREETHLQVSLHAERQLSMVLRMLGEMQPQLGGETQQNPELLAHLQQDLDTRELLANLRRDLRQAAGDNAITAP